MTGTPHRNNSDFQLRHFIAGSCHTADAAWSVLYEQKLDMENRITATRAQVLRRKAKLLRLEVLLADPDLDEPGRLCAEADLMEANSAKRLEDLALAGADAELATITSLMAELEPHRKFAHLPILEASEAAQRDEWSAEFRSRVENFLISQGTIPQDQLAAMRSHPDFEESILPHIKTVAARVGMPTDAYLLTNKSTKFLDYKG